MAQQTDTAQTSPAAGSADLQTIQTLREAIQRLQADMKDRDALIEKLSVELDAPAAPGADKSVAGLLAADQARYTAMAARDTATLDRLLAQELIYVHSGGEGQNRQGHFGDVAAGRGIYNKVTVLGALGRIYGDIGTVWGTADFDEGKDHRMSRLGYAETWIWRDKHWQLLMFHAARVTQPGEVGAGEDRRVRGHDLRRADA